VFKNKNILIISPEAWSHMFVSKHHYAVYLGKRDNRIYFLNPPSEKNELIKTDYKNIWEINYAGFPKGIRYLPAFLQRYFFKRAFHQLQELSKVGFDIIWSFDNSVFFDFSAFPENTVKISHIVDLNQDFQFEKAAKTADICFCTTSFIEEKLRKYNSNVFKINHGLNTSEIRFNPQLPGKNRVKAIYVGNLAMRYLDWEILYHVAKKNFNVDFIFIGDGKNDIRQTLNPLHEFKLKVSQLGHVYLLDKIPSDHIQSYLSAADILLVAYQEKFHTDQANPHKMMEYLGSGKMVVGTYTQEYSELVNDGLLLMSNGNREFPALFQSAASNLEYWNSIEKQEARQKYAFENTYDKQIDRIESISQL
jgi:hypothetical protein